MPTQIHEWTFELVSESPLYIGGENEEVVVDQYDRPMIPGTSLAGVCRAYIENSQYASLANALFGSQEERNPYVGLTFFDGRSKEGYSYEVRPSVSIDGQTRTAMHGQFFERLLLASGTVFQTKLLLKVPKAQNDKYFEAVDHLLQALNAGVIRIGAYQSIGAGKFTINNCQYVHYNCSDVDQLKAYVDQSKQPENYTFQTDFIPESVVKFTIEAKTDTPLLIGQQNSHDSHKPDITYMTTKHEGKEKALIPGSSLKGVLRSRVERIAKVLSLPNKTAYVEHLFGTSKNSTKKRASALRFEDTIIEEPAKKTYYRTAIDPFTGSVKSGALIDEETVEGKFTANIYLRVTEAERKHFIGTALLLFALRDLAYQQFSLGSRAGIGYGFVHVKTIEMTHEDKRVFIDVTKKEIEDSTGWLKSLDQQLQSEKEVVSS